MGPADESVSLGVGHQTGSSRVMRGQYEALRATYETTPVQVPRPPRDSSLVEVRCDHCDAVLSVLVLSVRRTILKRWLWATMMALGLLLIAWLLYEGFSNHFDGDRRLVVGSLVALLAGCTATGTGLGLLVMEHGLRLEACSSHDAPHALLSRHGGELGTVTRSGEVRGVMGLRRGRR
ncbi:hypothetical protein [Glycomyces buryatensis]|uniref:Uncharacterized protein n=1 Tax=Glycomyces buryatensis TaxID=2570927 RepID=A0A4S8PTD2_9ACTN|nr:hypothetical protein [Glycomyces buryatensis]THV33581.1 hypothetical protein FAB82_25940 [Glycomyces buryatensis]